MADPLPDLRELLFADLPPLTVLEQFAASPDLHELAGAVAREDAERARTLVDRVIAGTTETRIRLQAWSLARRVDIEPTADDARRARGVVIDVGLDGGLDTLAGYEDGTARYLNQGGGAIVSQFVAARFELRRFPAEGFLVKVQLGQFRLDGQSFSFRIDAARLTVERLLLILRQQALALLALILKAEHFALQVV